MALSLLPSQQIMSKAGIYKTSTHKNNLFELKKVPAWLTEADSGNKDGDAASFDPKNFPAFDADE